MRILSYATHCDEHGWWRTYDGAKLTAGVKATAHALRFQHHVQVYETNVETLSSRVIETHGPEKTEKNRLFDVDEPPF